MSCLHEQLMHVKRTAFGRGRTLPWASMNEMAPNRTTEAKFNKTLSYYYTEWTNRYDHQFWMLLNALGAPEYIGQIRKLWPFAGYWDLPIVILIQFRDTKCKSYTSGAFAVKWKLVCSANYAIRVCVFCSNAHDNDRLHWPWDGVACAMSLP